MVGLFDMFLCKDRATRGHPSNKWQGQLGKPFGRN